MTTDKERFDTLEQNLHRTVGALRDLSDYMLAMTRRVSSVEAALDAGRVGASTPAPLVDLTPDSATHCACPLCGEDTLDGRVCDPCTQRASQGDNWAHPAVAEHWARLAQLPWAGAERKELLSDLEKVLPLTSSWTDAQAVRWVTCLAELTIRTVVPMALGAASTVVDGPERVALLTAKVRCAQEGTWGSVDLARFEMHTRAQRPNAAERGARTFKIVSELTHALGQAGIAASSAADLDVGLDERIRRSAAAAGHAADCACRVRKLACLPDPYAPLEAAAVAARAAIVELSKPVAAVAPAAVVPAAVPSPIPATAASDSAPTVNDSATAASDLRRILDAVAEGGWCSGEGTSDPEHRGPTADDAISAIREFYDFREEVWNEAADKEAKEVKWFETLRLALGLDPQDEMPDDALFERVREMRERVRNLQKQLADGAFL